jgi:hypothetical protein
LSNLFQRVVLSVPHRPVDGGTAPLLGVFLARSVTRFTSTPPEPH